MNNTADELRMIRSRLLDAVDRDLSLEIPRSRTIRHRLRLAISTLAVLATATAAIVLGLTLGAASPQSAYAAAKKAIAATSADALDSGTMTSTFRVGNHATNQTTQWHGNDLSISGDHLSLWATQVLLVGGNVYVQQRDGTWQHYANESDAGRLARPLQMARVDVAGNSAAQILALVPDLQKMTQPDGSTVYTGTMPASEIAGVTPSDDTATRLRARLQSPVSSQFKLIVGTDGLVRQMSETADDGTTAWNVQYTQLGSTPPITAPANATDVSPGAAPQDTQTPHQTTVGSEQQPAGGRRQQRVTREHLPRLTKLIQQVRPAA